MHENSVPSRFFAPRRDLRLRVTARFFGLEYDALQSYFVYLLYTCVCLSVQPTWRTVACSPLSQGQQRSRACLAASSDPKKRMMFFESGFPFSSSSDWSKIKSVRYFFVFVAARSAVLCNFGNIPIESASGRRALFVFNLSYFLHRRFI